MIKQLDGSLSVSIVFDSFAPRKLLAGRNLELAV